MHFGARLRWHARARRRALPRREPAPSHVAKRVEVAAFTVDTFGTAEQALRGAPLTFVRVAENENRGRSRAPGFEMNRNLSRWHFLPHVVDAQLGGDPTRARGAHDRLHVRLHRHRGLLDLP